MLIANYCYSSASVRTPVPFSHRQYKPQAFRRIATFNQTATAQGDRPLPQHSHLTTRQQQVLDLGLRILARIIARSLLRRELDAATALQPNPRIASDPESLHDEHRHAA